MQINTSGITLEYERTGDGDPLLLIMGLGAQLVSWPPEFVILLAQRGFDCIRFDNRDSGLSTHVDEPYVVADMAADSAGLLDALDIEAAHIVGVSMGGMIAQSLAIEHADRVRSITSIMSNTGSPDSGGIHPDLLARLGELTTGHRSEAAETGIKMFRAISGSSFEEHHYRARGERELARAWSPDGTARQTAAIMAGPDRTAALASVTAPALVIHGREDPLVLPSGGEATAAAIPGARLVLHDKMGHNLPSPLWASIVDDIVAVTAPE